VKAPPTFDDKEVLQHVADLQIVDIVDQHVENQDIVD